MNSLCTAQWTMIKNKRSYPESELSKPNSKSEEYNKKGKNKNWELQESIDTCRL